MPEVWIGPCGAASGATVITFQGEYAVGSPPPSGYLAWHEWAEVQAAAGLEQSRCEVCGRWQFPQELSRSVDGVQLGVCLKCAPSVPVGGSGDEAVHGGGGKGGA